MDKKPFEAQYKEISDDAIVKMLGQINEYQPLAKEAIVKEAIARNIIENSTGEEISSVIQKENVIRLFDQIKNIKGLSINEINSELIYGGKFVVFQSCFSIIVMSFKRESDIYFIKAGESTIKYSIIFTLLTLICGWWGFPWGPIWSIKIIYSNLSGGKSVTKEVLSVINFGTEKSD